MKKLLAVFLVFSFVFAIAGCQRPEKGYLGSSSTELTKENLKEDIKEDITPAKEIKAGDDAVLDIEPKKVDKAFAEANTTFYLNLLTELNSDSTNTLISPLSILSALGMATNGAEGKTLKEMENVILGGMEIGEFNKYIQEYAKTDGKEEIKLANSVWIRPGIEVKDSFLHCTKGIYNSQVFETEFNSGGVNSINNWVKDKTSGKIPKIVDGLDNDTAMVLVNALHFKARWSDSFSENATKRRKFTNANGKKVDVDMMYSRESQYLQGENCTGFIKHYEGDYSFAALLPSEDISVEEFLSTTAPVELNRILSNPKDAVVDIAMPKFKLEYDASLKKALKALGVETAFSNTADFSKIAEDLCISDVLHKTTITLDEIGTEAAAATAVVFKATGALITEEIKSVTLDRPFVYFIIDNTTNLPIFCGTINQMESVK